MIVIVKGKHPKQLIIKAASVVFLSIMFAGYYLYMSNKFANMSEPLVNNQSSKINQQKLSKAQKLENIIYKEAKVIANLLNQKNIRYIKVVKDKLLISCDYDTNLEPLLVRYGVNAMVKRSAKDIKIAIDLAIIVENKYEK